MTKFLLLWAFLCGPLDAVPRTAPPDPADGITQEMMDQDENNRQQGYAVGVSGEFFRYKHLFYKQPTEQDRDEARFVASKIRCDVCTLILSSLVQKAASFSEDHLADMFEGNDAYEATGDIVEDRMLSHKKGCNKHFKDELIAQGWTIRVCKDVEPERNDSGPCLWQEADKPNAMATDAYEIWKEGLFYACEQTVGSFNDVLAEHLADALPKSSNRTSTIRLSCEKLAKCITPERSSPQASKGRPPKRARGSRGSRASRGRRGSRATKAGEL